MVKMVIKKSKKKNMNIYRLKSYIRNVYIIIILMVLKMMGKS